MVQAFWNSIVRGFSAEVYQARGLGLTDIGKLRNHNEDAIFVSDTLALYLVADGMGGHAHGEVASAMAVETISTQFSHPNSGKTADSLKNAIQAASRNIYDRSVQEELQEAETTLVRRMGTTVVALAVSGNYAVIAHAGDSRAYRHRDFKLERLTRDHSLSETTLDGMPSSVTIRSNLKNIITRALGIEAELKVEIREEKVRKDDLFLLCSDGLTNMVSDREIEKTLSSRHSDPLLCKELIETANNNGGKDNISCILIRCS